MKSTTPVHKIKTEFSLPQATSVGGSHVFLAYLEKIKLAEALKSLFCGKAGNALFPVHRILLYLLVGWTLGCERLFHFRRLQQIRCSGFFSAAAVRIIPYCTKNGRALAKAVRMSGWSCVRLITTSFGPACPPSSFSTWTPQWRRYTGTRIGPPKTPIRTSPGVKATTRYLFSRDSRASVYMPSSGQGIRILPRMLPLFWSRHLDFWKVIP